MERNRRKTRVGIVTSDKMDKTIVVATEEIVRHPLYGKGAPEYWVAVVKPGRVMFEIDGVTEAQAREAMRLAAHKLPIKCKFVVKGQEGGAQ